MGADLAMLALSCLLVLGTTWAASHEADALPGWLGERDLMSTGLRGSGLSQSKGQRARGAKQMGHAAVSRVEAISWKPRAFVYHGFLSDDECAHLIKLAKPSMTRSTVADSDASNEGSSLDDSRTSSGTFLPLGEDEVVSRIEERIAQWTFLPVENGEDMQILEYKHDQKYEAHFDYFEEGVSKESGGHRYATVIMYLSHVEAGGETTFPEAEKEDTQDKSDGRWSACGKKGVAVRPIKGDALLFWSLSPDGQPDEWSLHAGCPVVRGTKWAATKWIRVSELPENESED